MEHLEQQKLEQDGAIVDLRVQLGVLLSRERLGQQKEVVDVAQRLMLSKLQLLAIEAGEASSFHHERRYIQGIKAYTFYLGLQSRAEVNALVTQIESWSTESSQASPAAGVAQLHRMAAAPVAAKSYGSRKPRVLYLGLGVLVLGAIVLAISEGWPFKEDTQEIAIVSPEKSATTSTLATPLSTPQVRAVSASPSMTATPNAVVSTESAARPTEVSSQITTQLPPSAPPTIPSSSLPQTLPQTQADRAQTNVSASAPAPVLAPLAVSAPAEAQEGKAMMRVDFNAECWVSLQTVDGKKQDRIYKSGESLSVPVANVSALVLGNAPAVKVTLAGRQVNLMTRGITQGNVTRLDQKGIQLLQKN